LPQRHYIVPYLFNFDYSNAQTRSWTYRIHHPWWQLQLVRGVHCMADTRRQILLTIKEQLQLLKEPLDPLNPSRQHRWSPQQWWESFTFLVRIVSRHHHAAAKAVGSCSQD
jgi:hypothetical protein